MPGKAGGKSTALTGKKKKGKSKTLDASDIEFKKKMAEQKKAEKAAAAALLAKKGRQEEEMSKTFLTMLVFNLSLAL